MAQLSITVPDELARWIDGRIAAGIFVDAADYLRDLVRRDQDAHLSDVRRVQALIDAGLASGVVDAEPEDVLREIVAGIPARDG